MERVWRLGFIVSLLVLAMGCGPSQGTDGGGFLDAKSCSTALDCPQGVCDPKSNTCTESLTCTAHLDCGLAAYCDAFGMCQKGSVGTPCSTADQCPTNCFGAEPGQDGVCGCTGEEFEGSAVEPHILIVLDRSGSMSGSKWTGAKQAVTELVNNFGSQANLGLTMFPGDQDCTIYDPDVDIGPNTASTIISEMNSASPSAGATPITNTFSKLWSSDPFTGLDPAGAKAIIFMTDGGESGCGGSSNETLNHVRNLYNQRDILTFAIGYGAGASSSLLQDIAEDGGTMNYHDAPDGQALANVLAQIVGSILPCTFEISGDPNGEIAVVVDGTLVPSGWTFDSQAGELTFDQQTCDALRQQGATEVTIVSSCSPE